MDLDEAGVKVKYLIRDRDAKFPALFDRILTDAGIDDRAHRRTDAAHELDHGTVGADLPPRTPRPHPDLERNATYATACTSSNSTTTSTAPTRRCVRPHRCARSPTPITDPDRIAHLDIRRNDRLGGIIHEYQHAA